MANEFSLGLWLQVDTVGKRMKGVVPEELKGRVEADVIKIHKELQVAKVLRVRGIVFARENTSDGYLTLNVSPETVYIQLTSYRLSRVSL